MNEVTDRLSGANVETHSFVCRLLLLAVFVAVASTTIATPPARDKIGASFSIISQDGTTAVAITIRPDSQFDVVSVEGGSGVAALEPPCAFHNVSPGQTYSCHVNLTQKASEPSSTINVVAEIRSKKANRSRLEVAHFTVANKAFVRANRAENTKPPSLMRSSAESK